MAPSNGNGNSMLQQQQQRWRVYVNDERERAQWWREGRHTRYDRFSIYLLFQTSPATLENEPYVLVFKDGEWLPPPPPLIHLPPHPLLSKKSQSCSFLRMGTIHHLPTTHLPIHLLPDPPTVETEPYVLIFKSRGCLSTSPPTIHLPLASTLENEPFVLVFGARGVCLLSH